MNIKQDDLPYASVARSKVVLRFVLNLRNERIEVKESRSIESTNSKKRNLPEPHVMIDPDLDSDPNRPFRTGARGLRNENRL